MAKKALTLEEKIKEGDSILNRPQVTSGQLLPDTRSRLNEINVRHISSKDRESFEEYDVNVTAYNNPEDWDAQRAENQGRLDTALNAIPRTAIGIYAKFGQNVASLASLDQWFDFESPEIEGNAMYDSMTEVMEWSDEQFPIYLKNPDRAWDPGDSAWWLKGYSDTLSSAYAFVGSTALTGSGFGAAFKGLAKAPMVLKSLLKGKELAVALRASSVLSRNAAKLAGGLTNLATAITSNHMEGFQVAVETGDSIRREAIENGATVEEANRLAAEGNAMAYNWNKLTTVLNLTSTSMVLTAPRATRQLMKKMTLANTLKKMPLEMGQEGLEEIINHLAQKRGEAHGRGSEFGFSQMMDEALSEEGLTSAFWGAIGGAHQVGISSIKNAIPLKRDQDGKRISAMRLNNARFDEQVSILERYDKHVENAGGIPLSSTFMKADKIDKLNAEMKKAIAEGDTKKIKEISDLALMGEAYESFERGTTQELIDKYDRIKETSELEGMDADPGSEFYYKKRAQEAIEKIENYEKIFLENQHYLNASDVFTSEVNKQITKEGVAEAKGKLDSIKAKAYTALTGMQESGILPKTINTNISEPAMVKGSDGTEILSEKISNVDLEIVIDPDKLQVIPDGNLTEDQINDINDQIANTEEFQEFSDGTTEVQAISMLNDYYSKEYEALTSNEAQRKIEEENEALAAELKEKRKEREQEKKDVLKKKKRKEKASEKKAKDTASDIEAALEEEKEPLTGPELEAQLTKTDEDPVEYPDDETGVEVELPEGFDPEKAHTEADENAFVETEEAEDKHETQEIYTESVNETVDETVEKLDEVTDKDFTNTTNDEDGTPVTLSGVKYAPNLLAYLSREYKEVFGTDPKTGKPVVNFEDVNNKLLDTLDLRLVTELFEGGEITLEIVDDPEIEMTNPFYTPENNEEKTVTWDYVKEKLNPSEYFKHIPIGAVINKGEKPAAFLHDPTWINPSRVDGSVVSLEQQKADLLSIREDVYNEGGMETSITNKGNGSIIRTHDNSQHPVTESFPDKNLTFAVVKQGELITSKDEDGDTKRLNIVNREAITANEGIYSALIPLKGHQATDEDAPFLAVPLRRNKVSAAQVDSIVRAVEIWWKASQQQDALTDTDKGVLSDPAFNETFIDEFSGLLDYLKSFIHVRMLDSSNARSDMHDQLTALRSKDESARILGEAGSSIYFGKPGMGEKDIHFINSSTPANQLSDLLTKLKEHLADMHVNVDISNDQKQGDFVAPIINNDGSVTPYKGTYGDFLKENSTTNLLSFQDKNGNYVYTIQHTLEFETDQIEEAPFDTTEETEVVTNAFGDQAALEGQSSETMLPSETITDEKGRTFTYFENTNTKDGIVTTTYTFNRSDKDSSQRNSAGVTPEVAFGNKGYEVAEDFILEGVKIDKVYEVRIDENDPSKADATVRYIDENGNTFKSEIILEAKPTQQSEVKEFDKKLADKIQAKLEALYPEIKLDITKTPKWEKGDNVMNQQEYVDKVNYNLKVVDALTQLKGDRKTIKLNTKDKPYIQKNLEKTLSGTVPKAQIQMIFDTLEKKGVTEMSTDDLITHLVAENSFVVEVNTAKSKAEVSDYDRRHVPEEYWEQEGIGIQTKNNSSYYSNLTVPGGTNYTENEIATPDITPNIKGHAQFSTDKGIGWFRSDDKFQKFTGKIDYEKELKRVNDWDFGAKVAIYFNLEEPFPTKAQKIQYLKENLNADNRIESSKTRRILEVQSDLFQKGRDKKDLVTPIQDEYYNPTEEFTDSEGEVTFIQDGYNYRNHPLADTAQKWKLGEAITSYTAISDTEFKIAKDKFNTNKEAKTSSKANDFLQLLNQKNNWVTFFTKSIIQDSVKKGYKKVLFPKGDTAARIEGHATLEGFKKEKEARIKELESKKLKVDSGETTSEVLKNFGNSERFTTDKKYRKESFIVISERYRKEIETLKQELADVESGKTQLSSIANFYEETVTNILKKQGYNPVEITDEYGNKWSELQLTPNMLSQILLQKDEANKIIGQANITAGKVLIDAINQKQDTLPHEYAHHYIAWFRDSAIVQEGIKKWGSEEALVQSIGEQVVKQKGEALSWWKKFTKWIADQFNNLSALEKEELTEILTDAFLTRQDLSASNKDAVTYNNRQYTVKGDKIFNKDGKEVYKKDNKNRRDILALAAPKETAQPKSATESILEKREEEVDDSIVTVTGLDGEEFTFDLNNTGEENVDSLPSFNESTYEGLDEISRLLIVPGLTVFQSKAAVDFLVNTINKTAYKAYRNKDGKVSKSELLNHWKTVFSGLAAHAQQNNFGTASFFTALTDNWSDYTRLVDKALLTTRTIQEEGGDLDPQAFVAVGADLEKKKHDDGSLSVDSKKGASPSIKRFLSSMMALEKVEDENGAVKYKPVTTIGGLKKYVGWDTAYNTLKPLLSGSVPNIDSQILTLETYQDAHPWLNGLIKELKEDKSEIRNEFASSMAQHMLDMRTTLYSVDDQGNFSMINASTNINAVGREVQEYWKEGAKAELFITSERDFNDYEINPALVNELLNEYENLGTEGVEQAFDWLAKLGIEVSDTTVEGIKSKGLRQGGKVKPFSKFFLKGGLFHTVFTELKRHQSGITLSKGSLYSNSPVKALAVAEAMYNPVYYSNNFRDGENKSRFAHTANKYLISRLRDLKRNPERVKKLSKIGFSVNSDLYKAILNKEEGKESDLLDTFAIFYNDTLKKRDSRRSGITNSKATPAQLEQIRLGNFFNAGTKLGGTGKVTKRITILNYMNTSDKKVPMSYRTIAHNTAMTRDGGIGSSTINTMYDKIVLPEIKRALFFNSNKDKINVEGYTDGAGQFLKLPELNAVEGVMINGKMNPDILSDPKIVAALKAKLNEYVEDAITQKLEEWEKFEIGGDSLAWIDKDYLAAVKAPKDNKVRYAAADYIVNTMIGNSEIHKVFAGDPALYFKSKHYKNVIAEKGLPKDIKREDVLKHYTAQDWIQETKDTYDNVSKRLAADIAPGTEIAYEEGESRVYTQGYLKDKISESAVLGYLQRILGPKAAAYAEINTADAQEYTTLQEHLYVLKGMGKLTPDKYNELLEKIDKEKDDLVLSPRDLGLVLNPQKPVYVNNDIVNVGSTPAVDVRNYIKSSSFPLIPQFTKNSKLDAIRKAMEGGKPSEPKIARLAFESAVKVGMTKDATSIDGEITTESLLANSKTLNREGFRIQQEVPHDKEKHKIRDGSQQRVLLFANALDAKIGDTTGSELKNEYDSIYGEIYSEAYDKLMGRLRKGKKLDIKALSDMLITEAIDRNYPFNDIYTLGYDKKTKNFRVPLWANPSSSKIEALINGVINKQIWEQKMNGNSFVLGSEAGTTPIKTLDELTKKEKNGIVYTDKYNQEEGLKYRDEDGFAQIMVQNRIKDKNGKVINLRKYMKGNLLDPNKLPVEVLEGMGFRIPTQGHNSMAKVRIVGFLPDAMGDLIIAPQEFVVQMGSDFDVDKLFVRFHNLTEVKGKLVKVKGGTRKAKENRLLDISLKMLGSEAVAPMMHAPLDFGLYKGGTTGLSARQNELVKTISEAKGEPDYMVNPIGPTYQRDKYIEGRAGQTGISVFSLDSTMNAGLQVPMEDLEMGRGVYLKLEAEDSHLLRLGNYIPSGDLSSPYTLRTQDQFQMLSGNQGVLPAEIRYKSEVIAASQSASVDNANERILEKLNINSGTFTVMKILAQLGYEEDIISAFINQPIVVEYTEEVQKLKNQEEKVNDPELVAYQTIQDKYAEQGGFSFSKISNDQLNKLRDEASVLEFEDLISNISDRGNDAAIQQVLLEKFAYLGTIGQELSSVQQTTNTAASGLGASGLENIEKLKRIATLPSSDLTQTQFPLKGQIMNQEVLIGKYEDSPEGVSIPVSYFNPTKNRNEVALITPTTLNGHGAIHALRASQEIMNELFHYDKTLARKMFRDVETNLPGSSADITSVAARRDKIFKAFKRYVYSGVTSEIPSSERMRLFFDTEENESVASKLKKYQEDSILKNNTFIQRLKAYVKQGDKPSTIGYNASAVENEAEDDMYASFISLITDVRTLEPGYTTKDFADDLVKTMFLGDAIQEATQFVRYIPANYLTKGSFMEAIQSINWKNKSSLYDENDGLSQINTFTRQFAQHDPREATEVLEAGLKNSKSGDDVITLTTDELDRISHINSKGDRILPSFIAINNKAFNKNYALYEYKVVPGKGEAYVRIETLGTKGMTEYSFKENSETNIGKNKPAVKTTQVTLADLEAQQNALAELDEKEGRLNEYGGDNNVNKSKAPTTDRYKLTQNGKAKNAAQATLDTLEHIVKDGTSNANKLLAAEFLTVAKRRAEMGVPIESSTNSKLRDKGVSYVDDSIIQINPTQIESDQDFEASFLHEVGHQATIMAVTQGLNNGSKAATRLLGHTKVFEQEYKQGRFNDYIEGISNEKEKADLIKYIEYIIDPKSVRPDATKEQLDRIQIQELTTFAMSNPHIQTMLKSVKYNRTNQTFWDKLFSAWEKLLKEFGLGENDSSNLLSAVLADTFSLIQESYTVNPSSVFTAKKFSSQENATAEQVAAAMRKAEEINAKEIVSGDDIITPEEGDTHEEVDLLPGNDEKFRYPAVGVPTPMGHRAEKLKGLISSNPDLREDIANAMEAEGTNVGKAINYYINYKLESGRKINPKELGTISDMINFRRYAETETEKNLRGSFTKEEMERAKKLLPLIQRGLLPLNPKKLAEVMAKIKMC